MKKEISKKKDDAFYFIFDIDNSHQLIVNVPRKKLRDMRLPKMRTRESHSYLKIQSILKSCVRKGFYIIQNKTIVNILTPKSLEMQLLQKLSQNKADLSNHIIEVLNYQLSFQPHQPLKKNHSHGSLARHVREGYFILDTHLKE